MKRLASSNCFFLLRKSDFSMFESFILEFYRIHQHSGFDQVGKILVVLFPKQRLCESAALADSSLRSAPCMAHRPWDEAGVERRTAADRLRGGSGCCQGKMMLALPVPGSSEG